MVVGVAWLAQRAQLRSTPLLVSAACSSSSNQAARVRSASASRNFSVAASASPKSASVRTSAYNSATFIRASIAFPTQSILLAGKPFSSTIASRNLSLWPFSKSSNKPADASTVSSEFETKKDDAIETASNIKDSAETHFHDAGAIVSDDLESTKHTASDTIHAIEAKVAEAHQSLTETFSNVDPAAVSTVSEAMGGAMGVKAGELTELGLNHWVSPPGWITNLLEFVGTTTGLPWWGTIAVTTVILRLLIAPINIAGQKNAIRLGNISPKMKRHMDDIKHYKAAGDQMEMQKAVMATQKLLRDNNANPIKSLVPIAFQLPLMFSFYVALERIAKSGAYSFAHGGPFWTMDLTVPDPTWVLPAVSTLATVAVAELGFKTGTNSNSDPGQTQMMKYIFRGFMPILGWIATTMPSGVLVYWSVTNIYSLLQLAVLQIPIVRQWAKFPKRIVHPKNPYQDEPKGMMDRIRAARDQLSDSSSAKQTVKPVVSSTTPTTTSTAATGSVASSRADALKEILDDKATYEATTPAKAEADAAAQRNRERVLKARQRRARK